MGKKIIWSESYRLGIENIDHAHKQLFSIVNRLQKIAEEQDKNSWICKEGIKYFKDYARKHFAEEEAFMRAIRYKDYARHKRLHDNMRDKTIPSMERNMMASNYSTASINQFLDVCLKWLVIHITKEDKAIIMKSARK